MPRSEPESWQRNVWALALVVFTAFVGFQFFSPFLPLYVHELGVTDPAQVAVWSGVLMAVTPGVSGLLGPLWGRLSDRVGRKLMLIRSLAGFVVIIAAMGLVTSVYQLFVARLLQGVFAGFSVMAMAVASVSCPRDKVPVAIGRVQSAQLLSAAVGPVAGGYVASHFGIRSAFFVTAGLCALALVGLIVLFKEERPGRAGEVTQRPPHLSLRESLPPAAFPARPGPALDLPVHRPRARPSDSAESRGPGRRGADRRDLGRHHLGLGRVRDDLGQPGRAACSALADRAAAPDRLRDGRGSVRADGVVATRGSSSWSCAVSSASRWAAR